MGIVNYYEPDGNTDWENILLFSIIGLILITINVIIYDKFKLVRLNRQKLTFKENGEEMEIEWTKIKRINRIPLVSPATYYAKIKDTDQTIIFPTESNYRHAEIQIPFVSLIFD
jgi:hypothetical protein